MMTWRTHLVLADPPWRTHQAEMVLAERGRTLIAEASVSRLGRREGIGIDIHLFGAFSLQPSGQVLEVLLEISRHQERDSLVDRVIEHGLPLVGGVVHAGKEGHEHRRRFVIWEADESLVGSSKAVRVRATVLDGDLRPDVVEVWDPAYGREGRSERRGPLKLYIRFRPDDVEGRLIHVQLGARESEEDRHGVGQGQCERLPGLARQITDGSPYSTGVLHHCVDPLGRGCGINRRLERGKIEQSIPGGQGEGTGDLDRATYARNQGIIASLSL